MAKGKTLGAAQTLDLGTFAKNATSGPYAQPIQNRGNLLFEVRNGQIQSVRFDSDKGLPMAWTPQAIQAQSVAT